MPARIRDRVRVFPRDEGIAGKRDLGSVTRGLQAMSLPRFASVSGPPVQSVIQVRLDDMGLFSGTSVTWLRPDKLFGGPVLKSTSKEVQLTIRENHLEESLSFCKRKCLVICDFKIVSC